MFAEVRKVNEFFRGITQPEPNDILNHIVLSDRQKSIFMMYYINRKNIGFIADTLFVSESVIKRELKIIRDKLMTLI